MGDNGPDAGGRRRTDPSDALWRGAGPVTAEPPTGPRFDRGDASRRAVPPVLVPEARAVRVPSGATSRARMADAPGLNARPRPPMPPVPPPVAPRTSAAPFAAVPSPAPEHESLRPSATAVDERRPAAAAVLPDIPSPGGPPLLSQPVPELPSRPVSGWSDGEHLAPWSTGRGEIRADRGPAGLPESAPFVERRASRLPSIGLRPSAAQADMPAYGDWTKPSGPGRVPSAPVPPVPSAPPAPLTSAIPDRDLSGRAAADLDDAFEDDRYEDDRYDAGYADPGYDDRYEDDVDARDAGLQDPAPASGPMTGTVVGGRAALRAERESREAARVAAEVARRKSAGLDELEEPRRNRRMLKGLVAVAAVAAAVVGVYTVATPANTDETSSTSAPSAHTPAAIAPTSAPAVTATLAPLDTEPELSEAEAAPVAPVRVPVTVLNETEVDGLAADISAAIKAKGWKTAEPGGYPPNDVAATTVFFTEGDDKQRQAALQLIEQFPQLQGPTPRFFEVPSSVDAPGLVIVAAGDWKP